MFVFLNLLEWSEHSLVYLGLICSGISLFVWDLLVLSNNSCVDLGLAV